ncbi:MAG: SDR family NAD(P)-dependent oxidoreductase, partial [Chloroflexota bacterium]
SGLGLEMAKIYGGQNNRLILIGRKPLENLPDDIFVEENYCQADLSSPDAHLTIDRWLTENQISTVDLLIHNAGIGWYGEPQDQSPAEVEKLIQVNLKAPIALTHILFDRLVEAVGKVVFVSSVVSQLPTKDFAVYTASKAALDGFARSLAVEAAGRFGVQVLHPGATRTDMHAKIGMEQATYEKFKSAESVAAEMVQAIERGKRNIAIGFGNKVLRTASMALPRLIERLSRKAPKLKVKPNDHIVVTGGADGIGGAIVQKYAERGENVTILDIDRSRSEAITQKSGERVSFLLVDMSEIESLQAAVDVLGQHRKVTTLVNNAGISAAGRFEDLDLDDMLKVIDINLTGAIVLTNLLLKKNLLDEGYTAVFVSSLSKYVGYPGAAVYSASKDGLASYASSLQVAGVLRGQSLTVFPGPTRTAHARRYSPDNSREDKRMLPEAVADEVYAAVRSGKRLLFPGGSAKMFAFFGRMAPRLAERAMKGTIYDKLA